jgi:hypothetical protein
MATYKYLRIDLDTGAEAWVDAPITGVAKTATTVLAAGDFVTFDAAGTVTKAIAGASPLPAQGFVLTSATTASNNAIVYVDGVNTSVVQTLTIGADYYLTTTSTLTTVSDSLYVQYLGYADSANSLVFTPDKGAPVG